MAQVKPAAYCCLRCGHRWTEPPRRVVSNYDGSLLGWTCQAECPACGHLYILWLDYNLST